MSYLELLTGPISSLGVPYRETSSLLWVENLTLLSGMSGWLGEEEVYPSDMPWFSRRCLVSSLLGLSRPDSLLPSLNDCDLLLLFIRFIWNMLWEVLTILTRKDYIHWHHKQGQGEKSFLT